MLRGRSESDSVLPSGDSAYASTDPSCAGMLLERVILGALLTGLDAAVKRTTCESLVRTQVLSLIQVDSPVPVLDDRGSEVGDESRGRANVSLTLKTVWECLLSPRSFDNSSA